MYNVHAYYTDYTLVSILQHCTTLYTVHADYSLVSTLYYSVVHCTYTTLNISILLTDETIVGLVADPDRNLVSLCVEKVVVAKLAEMVRTGYDPLSSSSTRKLIGNQVFYLRDSKLF